ncbi:MAG: hypothetical protein M3Q89_04375 [Verrucomicrobiota bacterium]|nr:hypothetical protein [Verrucomicrobiota bacterium]
MPHPPAARLQMKMSKVALPGGPTTPLPEYGLRGAILENAGGDVYVKMTGPETVVKAATPAFKEMVRDAAHPPGR